MKKVVLLTIVLNLAGCATPEIYTETPMIQLDKNTQYAVVERPDGFDLTVAYSRYQFIPESAAVATACRAALTSTAWEIAKKRGKEIQPVNEQRIKISMGRNGLAGITSCSATVPVEWKQ
jgi:uncharacterized lipoprotein